MEAMTVASEIIDEIALLSDRCRDSDEWFVLRDDGSFLIDELQDRIEAILREAGLK